MRQHSFHTHTHRIECVHTSTCHIKTWPYKQRDICRCVCVCLRVMWYHDPHPDVREGPINIQRHQECETHEATDLPLPLTLMNHSIHLFFSFYLKNDLLSWMMVLIYQPRFVSGVPEGAKLQKAAHSITLMPTRQR